MSGSLAFTVPSTCDQSVSSWSPASDTFVPLATVVDTVPAVVTIRPRPAVTVASSARCSSGEVTAAVVDVDLLSLEQPPSSPPTTTVAPINIVHLKFFAIASKSMHTYELVFTMLNGWWRRSRRPGRSDGQPEDHDQS